nr:iron transporter [Rhodomicrobium udaipurense]
MGEAQEKNGLRVGAAYLQPVETDALELMRDPKESDFTSKRTSPPIRTMRRAISCPVIATGGCGRGYQGPPRSVIAPKRSRAGVLGKC